jgi:hypothetical protein
MMVVAGAHAFRVMPEGVPGGGVVGHDGRPFTVPGGWRLVSRADLDFDAVRVHVIAAYGWSAYFLVVAKAPTGAAYVGLAAFRTLNCGPEAGATCEDGSNYVTALGSDRYQVRGGYGHRLLLRRCARDG